MLVLQKVTGFLLFYCLVCFMRSKARVGHASVLHYVVSEVTRQHTHQPPHSCRVKIIGFRVLGFRASFEFYHCLLFRAQLPAQLGVGKAQAPEKCRR